MLSARRHPAPDSVELAIGVDLGGTKVSAVLLDTNGSVLESRYRAHDGSGEGAVASVAEAVQDLAPLVPGDYAVGLAAAGLVDRDTGELVHSALLEIHAIPLAATLSARFGVDVLIENDANATLAGIHDSALTRQTALLLTLGTGVGGAFAVDGRIAEGSFGYAAELGHIPVHPEGDHPCPCGGNGCLELFASGTAVAARGSEAGLTAADGESVRAEDVVAAAIGGDRVATGILAAAGREIGVVLIGLIATLDPEVVYVSGGFGHAAAPFLIPAIQSHVAAHRPFASARPAPRIVTDQVGPLAAAIGAARLAQQRGTRVSERNSNDH